MVSRDRVELIVDDQAFDVEAGTPLRALGITPPPDAVAFTLNGRVYDFQQGIRDSGRVAWLTFREHAGREVFRHSSAHLLAQAVKRLWPDAQLGTGPATEEGFYYDILLPRPLGESELSSVEEEMRRIVQEDLAIERLELSRDDAMTLFRDRGEELKLDIISRIPDGATISAYRQGEFVDLCTGPHLPSTGRIRALKLTGVSGAYWRGDEANPMLTRIYGTSYPSQEELEAHLYRIEEAKRRDHRRVGPALGLFSFREEAPGFAFWHPKGQRLYRTLEEFSRRLQEPRGYQEVATPWIYRVGLWKQSGHWDHYRENMFVIEREDETLGVKPMNCPGHCLLFQSEVRSYRDLPIRYAEYGPLSRFERSGTLHGLMRVRGLHQDDAHLFVREDQIGDEMQGVLDLVDHIYRTFGMPYEVVLSTRPENFMGALELWERAESALREVLERRGLPYQINPGDGAFYGPKLDFYAVDALGRRWQCATAQLDFQLPVQFDLTYVDRDGQPKRPVMIHRAIMGSLERFIGILVEHYGGDFPLWLAPVQVRVIPVADAQIPYAEQVATALGSAGIRAEVDRKNQKLGYKVREAEVDKIPVVLVVGRRDEEQGTVSVRMRPEGDLGAHPWPDYLEVLRVKAAMPV